VAPLNEPSLVQVFDSLAKLADSLSLCLVPLLKVLSSLLRNALMPKEVQSPQQPVRLVSARIGED
jgi:hypothetical protein